MNRSEYRARNLANLSRANRGLEPRLYGRVSARETRKHLLWLQANGVSPVHVAAVAGVGARSLRRVAEGQARQVWMRTEGAVLGVTLSAARAQARLPLVDATPAWEAVDALVAEGWSRKAVARHCGMSDTILYRRGARILVRHRDAILTLAADRNVVAVLHGRAGRASMRVERRAA